ncbi:hypothetical protein AWENTII_001559 [Aspergillus wentii]
MALPLFNQTPNTLLANSNDPARQQQTNHVEVPRDLKDMNARPRVGLLSHTVIPSPTIQWILPARLRSKHQNDVVFVGERHLQIKEAVSGIHLEDVTSKSDFDACIMAAKVINVGVELPWETQMKLGASNSNAMAGINLDVHNDLPPQMLVLSLASRELVFLYYSASQGGVLSITGGLCQMMSVHSNALVDILRWSQDLARWQSVLHVIILVFSC